MGHRLRAIGRKVEGVHKIPPVRHGADGLFEVHEGGASFLGHPSNHRIGRGGGPQGNRVVGEGVGVAAVKFYSGESLRKLDGPSLQEALAHKIGPLGNGQN